MTTKTKKIRFWRYTMLAIIFIIINCITFATTISALIYLIWVSQSLRAFTILFISAPFFILFLYMGISYVHVWVEVDSENIIVRKIFGIITQCSIDKIKRVYIQEGRVILKDDRIVKNSNQLKNNHVAFIYSKKRLAIIRTFWHGEIENLPPEYTTKGEPCK